MNENMSELFKILSDSNRLRIIELLLKGETCGCTLIDKLTITQPTLSYHLNYLVETGLATRKRVGNKIEHSINRSKLESIIDYINHLLSTDDKSCKI